MTKRDTHRSMRMSVAARAIERGRDTPYVQRPITDLSQLPDGFASITDIAAGDTAAVQRIGSAARKGKIPSVKFMRTVTDTLGPVLALPTDCAPFLSGATADQHAQAEPIKAPAVVMAEHPESLQLLRDILQEVRALNRAWSGSQQGA